MCDLRRWRVAVFNPGTGSAQQPRRQHSACPSKNEGYARHHLYGRAGLFDAAKAQAFGAPNGHGDGVMWFKSYHLGFGKGLPLRCNRFMNATTSTDAANAGASALPATSWKLLPDRPTPAMLAAGREAFRAQGTPSAATLYRRMWQAAPDRPADAQATALVRAWKRMPYHATETMHNAVRELLGRQRFEGRPTSIDLIYLTFWDTARGVIRSTPSDAPKAEPDAAAGNDNPARHTAFADGYRAGKETALAALLARDNQQQRQPASAPGSESPSDTAESYAELFNALQRIDTAAVSLPGFIVRHEGGIDAFTRNIVDAIALACQSHQDAVAKGTLDVKTLHDLVAEMASALECTAPGNPCAARALSYLDRARAASAG